MTRITVFQKQKNRLENRVIKHIKDYNLIKTSNVYLTLIT